MNNTFIHNASGRATGLSRGARKLAGLGAVAIFVIAALPGCGGSSGSQDTAAASTAPAADTSQASREKAALARAQAINRQAMSRIVAERAGGNENP